MSQMFFRKNNAGSKLKGSQKGGTPLHFEYEMESLKTFKSWGEVLKKREKRRRWKTKETMGLKMKDTLIHGIEMRLEKKKEETNERESDKADRAKYMCVLL